MKTTTLKSAIAAALFALGAMMTMPAQAADCPEHDAAPNAKAEKASTRVVTAEDERRFLEMYGGGN